MNSQEIDNRYVIAWSSKNLISLVNMTESSKVHFIKILMDEPDKDHISNPIRNLVVYGVSNKIEGFELWEFDSFMSESEILELFAQSSNTIKTEIRDHGVLIYSLPNKE